jgi:D-cysteine desulfhydrase
VGTLGYVNAGLELAEQIAAGECPHPAAIFVAAGTTGTQAGLMLGLALAGLAIPVYGVRVVAGYLAREAGIARLYRRAWQRLQAAGLERGMAVAPPACLSPAAVWT